MQKPQSLNLVCLSERDTIRAPLDDALARFGDRVHLTYIAPENALDSPTLADANGVLCDNFRPRCAPSRRTHTGFSSGMRASIGTSTPRSSPMARRPSPTGRASMPRRRRSMSSP